MMRVSARVCAGMWVGVECGVAGELILLLSCRIKCARGEGVGRNIMIHMGVDNVRTARRVFDGVATED